MTIVLMRNMHYQNIGYRRYFQTLNKLQKNDFQLLNDVMKELLRQCDETKNDPKENQIEGVICNYNRQSTSTNRT